MAHDLSIFQEYERLFRENLKLENTLLNVFVLVAKFCPTQLSFCEETSLVSQFHDLQQLR